MRSPRRLLTLCPIYLSRSLILHSRAQLLLSRPRATTRSSLQITAVRAMATVQQEYRLKLDDVEFGNGQKKEVEVEGIEGAKVLLLKVNDQLRALGPKCTREF